MAYHLPNIGERVAIHVHSGPARDGELGNWRGSWDNDLNTRGCDTVQYFASVERTYVSSVGNVASVGVVAAARADLAVARQCRATVVHCQVPRKRLCDGEIGVM